MTLALNLDRKAEAAALVHAKGIPPSPNRGMEIFRSQIGLGRARPGRGDGRMAGGQSARGRRDVRPFAGQSPGWVMAHLAPARNADERSLARAVSGGRRLPRAKGCGSRRAWKLDFTGPGHVRALLVLEEGVSLTLLEGVGAADFRNVGFEIAIGAGASLEHVRISPNAGDAILVEEVNVRIARGGGLPGAFCRLWFPSSRAWSWRLRWMARARTHLSGVSVLDAKRHSDVTTHVIYTAMARPTATNSCSSMSWAAMPRRSIRAR